jgi:hypothetical protein
MLSDFIESALLPFSINAGAAVFFVASLMNRGATAVPIEIARSKGLSGLIPRKLPRPGTIKVRDCTPSEPVRAMVRYLFGASRSASKML